MNLKPSWSWAFHSVVFSAFTLINALSFFAPESPAQLYYHLLLAYDLRYFFPYVFAVLSHLMNVTAIVILLRFLTHKPPFSAGFSRVFFVGLLISDVFGHHYEIKMLRAYGHDSPLLGLGLLFLLIYMHLPPLLYLAFRRRRTQPSDKE